MRIHVTGATGFLGSKVVDFLCRYTNCEVIASSPNRELALNKQWFNWVQHVEFSLHDADDICLDDMGNPDLLLHFGWQSFRDLNSPHQIEYNLHYSYTLIKRLIEQGLRDLSVIGSGFEFGNINGELSSAINPDPITLYAVAKDSLRRTLTAHCKDKPEVLFRWLRVFNVYGPGQHPKSIFGQLEAAIERGDKVFDMSPGEQLRDYLDAEVLGVLIGCASLQNHYSGDINCCSGKPISILKLVQMIIAECKASIKVNPGVFPYSTTEPMAYWGDSSIIKSIMKKASENPLINALPPCVDSWISSTPALK